MLKYLEQERNHPTPDTLFDALVGELPTLSRTSVYNTLNALEGAGLVRRVGIDDNQTRYDAFMPDHGHFKCLDCGKVFDFDTPVACPAPKGFSVCRRDMFLWGQCPECLKKQSERLN
jgi:Fur family peroxide stress response transcriptional regulator